MTSRSAGFLQRSASTMARAKGRSVTSGTPRSMAWRAAGHRSALCAGHRRGAALEEPDGSRRHCVERLRRAQHAVAVLRNDFADGLKVENDLLAVCSCSTTSNRWSATKRSSLRDSEPEWHALLCFLSCVIILPRVLTSAGTCTACGLRPGTSPWHTKT